MFSGRVMAQAPPNDDCENASEIIIQKEGYGLGRFISESTDVSEASRQFAELCVKDLEETGNCTKTVWYRFHIRTTRNVSIRLTQKDSAIPQIFAGFNIYSIPDCNYTLSDLEYRLPPLNKFGVSGNTCLGSGWYLIQVGCKKKAKGELWVELDVSAPASEPYDSAMGYYNFGMVSDESKTANLDMRCASLDQEEAQGLADSAFTKSVWMSVAFPPNTLYNSLHVTSEPGNLRYRIFTGPPGKDSVKSQKPFIPLVLHGRIIDMECPAGNGISRYFIQFIAKNNINSISITAGNSTYKADGWNTPQTDNVIDLDYTSAHNSLHYFNCEAYLKTHPCKNVIPPFLIRRPEPAGMADTFRFGAYTILNVLEDGGLNVKTQYQNTGGQLLIYALYEGDIRNTCNLAKRIDTMLYDYNGLGFKYCIKKGTYTLLTSVRDLSNPGNRQIISLEKQDYISKYYYPLNPELLPDFNPKKDQALESEKISFRNKDTVIKVGAVTIKGDLTFTEIYISETSDLTINPYACSMYMFSGQLSKGSAQNIPGMSYDKPQTDFSGCNVLNKGFYSFVLVRQGGAKPPSGACFPSRHSIGFYKKNTCQANNNIEPQYAFPINSNMDVLSATGQMDKLDYHFNLPLCRDCGKNSSIIPALSCHTKAAIGPNTNYYYYTFYLAGNASFSGVHDNYGSYMPYELFEGDAFKNFRIIFDTARIISACHVGTVICNLEGGRIYTLVLPVSAGSKVASPVVRFSAHRPSPNDFAAQAYDFGHYSANESRISSFTPVTCHTNGLDSDPLHNDRSDYRTAVAIPYKDTLNLRRPQGYKNLWYTFTVSGNLKMTFKSQGKYNNQNHELVEVYRYKGPYHRDFAAQLADNFDSTIKSMELVAANYQFGKTGSFYNCGENRYFMLLNEYYKPATDEYATHLSAELLTVVQDGDLCSNAVTGSYTNYGSYSLVSNNACHTYGNSPGETDKPARRKSTWYRISVTNLTKFDMEVRPVSIQGLLSFNVYGGTCGAMTRVTSAGNAYSYFTLSCMGSGDYWIQAICKESDDANIEFRINILNPVNTVCKPYDFKHPIAMFKVRGGCDKEDTVLLQNASTMGAGMRYEWIMNGQLFSTAIHPVFSRLDQMLKDSNAIRLIAIHVAGSTRDTFDLVYVRDTTRYMFRIQGPPISWCYEKLTLSVLTDYPRKINYTWTAGQYSSSPLSHRPVYTRNSTDNTFYRVTGESENCTFTDTFTTRVITTLHRYNDTFFCEGQRYVIKNNTAGYMHINSVPLRPGDSVMYTDKNRIQVLYRDSTCTYSDSVIIDVEKGPRNLLIAEDIYTCNKASRVLRYTKEPLLTYHWSTGDTTPSITVVKSGSYKLTGPFSKCRSLNQTFNLTMEHIDTNLLHDTIVCKYDEYPFINVYGNKFKVLYKNPGTDVIKVTAPVRVVLKVQRSECLVTDSAFIDIFPFSGRNIDSFYCDEKARFSMVLDGGDARQHNWYEQNITGRFMTIPSYGRYPVARIDHYGCKDTLGFNIITDCEFTVYIPTAFSPNTDQANEVFGPFVSGRFRNYDMTVYNRWGEMVFRTEDSKTWDGYYMGQPVIAGVYAYLVTIYDENGKPYVFKGALTVLD